MENLAEYYFEKLPQDTNPGLLLAKFFANCMDKEVSVEDIRLFNRLITLYGRTIPYFAILDVQSMSDVNLDNLLPLFSYFCKKRLEAKTPEAYNGAYVNLDKEVERIEKQKASLLNKKLKAKELD